ncbi:LPD29 domain-containing protein [Streptomyces luteireticuli]|uniref:LPD29 domain-containing protein n=1 Tax=Streptomyces luteireticuli TaxID=173858 RepID=UPI003556B82B
MHRLTFNADGHVTLPNRAARYTVAVHRDLAAGWEDVTGLVMPDGTISGAGAEQITTLTLVATDGLGIVDETGTVVVYAAHGPAFRLTPVEGWTRLTHGHKLANRYTAEHAKTGDKKWTPARTRGEEELTAGAAQRLAWRPGCDAAADDNGVIVIEQNGTAVRLTPVVRPRYRVERWDSRAVAKYLRAQLKKTFPGQKISVRCGRGSDHAYLDIRWTGGPSVDQVREVCDPWQGSDFDGMTDSMNQREPLLIAADGGELVEIRPLTDLFTYERDRPEGVEAKALALVKQETGNEYHWQVTPFTYQHRHFRGVTRWDQLRQVMDAIEAGQITVE